MTLLRLEDLHVTVGQTEVVRGVSLEVNAGEIHLLFGPNGSGKSSLLRAIMGLPSYTLSRGRVIFEGRDISTMKAYERAALGIALMHQNPRPLSVKLRQVVQELSRKYGSDLELIKGLNLDGLMDRELYRNFSGGEIKRTELALILLQKPKLALLDEPDSGVDLWSLRIVGRIVNELADRGVGVLLVTHSGAIAEHLRNVTSTHVFVNGRIVASGELPRILRVIRERGYGAFER